ncbi:hypothetical protein TNCV_159821 [Trichonephila clavipes]|uniref:Uncharacterized protein n=1 Tax=Trichonephila clavipes TaxID=2585209 RepID=A0A8X6REP7_TRICX|nr:hypothetical protein TNCV_159821 [Trichonephila clavipes]
MRYRNPFPRRGRLEEGEAERERNKGDVTRAREEERRKGAKSPKCVREAPKRSGKKECYCFFFRSRYEKEKESASSTYKRNSRGDEAGASFYTDPSSDERQRHLSVKIPEGSELTNMVANDAKMVTKVANLVSKNYAKLALPPNFGQVLIESSL